MHSLRMMAQGTRAAFVSACLLAGVWFVWACSRRVVYMDAFYWICERYGALKHGLMEGFFPESAIRTAVYDFGLSATRSTPVLEYQARIWHSPSGQRLMRFFLCLSPAARSGLRLFLSCGAAGPPSNKRPGGPIW